MKTYIRPVENSEIRKNFALNHSNRVFTELRLLVANSLKNTLYKVVYMLFPESGCSVLGVGNTFQLFRKYLQNFQNIGKSSASLR